MSEKMAVQDLRVYTATPKAREALAFQRQ